ncbi:GNAT family N-acetyltransferase [Chitinophaga sp. GCM10012297]|uniref:GNAT family N-acetyltransferase n=1 Tax=Chitinophaga chungangae TaxID=2821488 RepID=A0ABS3Y811_9BACT|nr:GNAT family N-acetyltransferase [Chitinophaga chungangae]MBO9150814.1 GNAT family N-acetyltransferase [Chitinophaga chungangae]
MAVDKSCKGLGIGEMLCYDNSLVVGSVEVVVDPLDEDARNFYKKYGFITLPDSEKMFISMRTMESLWTDCDSYRK